ncbi:MAG TPA: DNA methyltransferase, partial [Planctomycetota bacterium]|nr:DNA methyltransferase [Planctomycetota bacterium]
MADGTARARSGGGRSRRAALEAQPLLFAELRQQPARPSPLAQELLAFRQFGGRTEFTTTPGGAGTLRRTVDTYRNEFWTSAQRAGHSLHEVSYRACFKQELPAFFIDRLTQPGDVVYDPFSGRGTTALAAALRGRVPFANDISPLAAMLLRPRLVPPALAAIEQRLTALDLGAAGELPEELLVFFHRDTLREICALRAHLLARAAAGALDPVDDWIRMVAVNRLTGHSPGFFSVYTLPPNQAVSVAAQQKINHKRQQLPPRRSVPEIVLKKSRSLLADCDAASRTALAAVADRSLLSTSPADRTAAIADRSVQLVVTSPPFLDVVHYSQDNWLRCWFCGVDADAVPITMARTLPLWAAAMTAVFHELHRVLAPGGAVAFEVG